MPSESKIVILQASDDDTSTMMRILDNSFGNDAPFLDAYFPNHDTESGQAQGSTRLLAWKRSSPKSTFLKAVVQNSTKEEKLVGFAIWTFMTEPLPAKLDDCENVSETWPDKEEADHIRALWKDYVVPRNEAIVEANGSGAYVLEMLAVHSDYQRLGAGSALVRWGIDRAEKEKVVAVVESTLKGRRCYEKAGFETQIEEMKFDDGEGFAKHRKPLLHFMRKNPPS